MKGNKVVSNLLNAIALLIVIIIFPMCRDDGEDLELIHEMKYESSDLFILKPNYSRSIVVVTDSLGAVSQIWLGDLKRKQIISISDSSGYVSSILFSNESNDFEGRAYYFYGDSGYLEADYNYVNGVKTGNAVEYHDSSALLKTTMLYNEDGQLYFRLRYDRDGNIISKEGDDGRENE